MPDLSVPTVMQFCSYTIIHNDDPQLMGEANMLNSLSGYIQYFSTSLSVPLQHVIQFLMLIIDIVAKKVEVEMYPII